MSDPDFLAMLLEQTDRLFGDLIDRDLLAGVERGEEPEALRTAVEAFGLADALTVPADEGGLSFGDASAIFASFGYHAVPLPLGEDMLARALLARAGIAPPAGGIGLADEDGATAFGPALNHAVAWREGRLVLLPVGDTVATGISRQPRGTVDLCGSPIAGAAWPNALPDPRTLGAMLRASQIAGAIGRLLAVSVDYANTRQQFGRPIGRFQAVQQLLARLAAEAAAARSAADTAWAALDAGHVGLTAAVAKVRAGEAARLAASIAHQVHGAIGVTDEHILHYFTRRLWEWRLEFGSDVAWARTLAAAVETAPDGLWPLLLADCAVPSVEEFA